MLKARWILFDLSKSDVGLHVGYYTFFVHLLPLVILLIPSPSIGVRMRAITMKRAAKNKANNKYRKKDKIYRNKGLR